MMASGGLQWRIEVANRSASWMFSTPHAMRGMFCLVKGGLGLEAENATSDPILRTPHKSCRAESDLRLGIKRMKQFQSSLRSQNMDPWKNITLLRVVSTKTFQSDNISGMY